MFDGICVRTPRIGLGAGTIDVGKLAEMALFYQRVVLVADGGTLRHVLRAFGPDTFLEYVTSDRISVEFVENGIGIQSQGSFHRPAVYEFPQLTADDQILSAFIEATGKEGRGRRLGNRFIARIQTTRYANAVADVSREDFGDAPFISKSVAIILKAVAPEYRPSAPLRFEVLQRDNDLEVVTNIDFTAANESYHRRIPREHSSLSTAYILSIIAGVRGNVFFAAKHGMEMSAEGIAADIALLKISELVRRQTTQSNEIDVFHEFAVNAPGIADAINTGHRTMTDFLRVLDAASEFRHWLKNIPHDASLLREYIGNVASRSWIDKLPSKAVRWSLFAGAGVGLSLALVPIAGIVAGLTLSAADTFLVDSIARGWRPNQFVNETLRPFLEPK